jgi:hypothetical protein
MKIAPVTAWWLFILLKDVDGGKKIGRGTAQPFGYQGQFEPCVLPKITQSSQCVMAI